MTTSHILSTLSNEQEVLLNLQPKYAPSAAAHGIAGNDPGQGFATSHLTGLPAGTVPAVHSAMRATFSK